MGSIFDGEKELNETELRALGTAKFDQTDTGSYAKALEKTLGDPVNHPQHYTKRPIPTPGEVIDAIEAWDLPYHLGNVVKYIARYRDKGTAIQDLKKARWYLDRFIAKLEKEGV